jgi:hypothetical protein
LSGEEEIFDFPIPESNEDSKMKNINPPALPHFHGLVYEYLDTFLFDFVVICRTYYYTTDEKNLKSFPSTLKDFSKSIYRTISTNNDKHSRVKTNISLDTF